MSAPLLEVEDLHIRFGAFEAVRGITFAIGAGETLGLVGESGSGKSATSLALMRLLPPSAAVTGQIKFITRPGGGIHVLRDGEHWVRNEDRLVNIGEPARLTNPNPFPGERRLASRDFTDLLTLPESAMRSRRGSDIAMIFQEPMTALNPVMSVGRQIAEAVLAHAPRTPRAELRSRVLAAMHEVALPDPERRLHDFPHQFSGGQRQRIVIAMALINRPRLLIADEPTTALDVTVQAQILDLLRRLKRERSLAMLFISHDLAVVGQVADRVAVMQRGLIVEQGTVAKVLGSPAYSYTCQLLAALPTMRTDRNLPLPV